MNGQNWFTVTVSVLLPAVTVMIAGRALPVVLASTVTLTRPPVPEVGETLHQLWLLLTDQLVLELIVSCTLSPAELTETVFGATVRVAGVTVSVAGEEGGDHF